MFLTPARSASDESKDCFTSLKNSEAKKLQDLIKWRRAYEQSTTRAFASALGLHKDPSRGHTHIAMQEVEYTPNASRFSDPKSKFRTSRIGVFKISDVVRDIERMSVGPPGNAQAGIDLLIKDMMALDPLIKREKAPVLNFSFERTRGGKAKTWLAGGKCSSLLLSRWKNLLTT